MTWRTNPRARLALLAAAPLLFALTSCAAGSPAVAPNRTATAESARQTQVTAPTVTPPPSATLVSTVFAANSPTTTTAPLSPAKTPKPKATATPEPTARPKPPADDGVGMSQIFDHGTSGRREIALTFDAGADRGSAEQILNTLDAAGIKGSFGMTGMWAKANPDLVKRMVKEGHMVFNHTWDHRSFTGYSTAGSDEGVLATSDRDAELEDTQQAILNLTGYHTAPYFRPPYGDYDDGVLTDVEAEGYSITVMWSCDTLGWNGATVSEILDRCVSNPSPGDIILMHVGAGSADADALAPMIKQLQGDGYDLVTVEQLLTAS